MTVFAAVLLSLAAQTAPAPVRPSAPPASTAPSPSDDYVIGPRDVIAVTVYGEEDYSRPSLTVDHDGNVEYTYLGSVKVGGLTTRQVEQDLVRRLSPRYLRNPNVVVSVKEFRSQRVWVSGAVRSPQQVELKGGATLMNALSAEAAGPLLPEAGSYILITHAPAGQAGTGPVLPGQNVRPEDQLRISRQDFELGRASAIRLRDGDTIYVPMAERFFVSGEVKQTGAFIMNGEINVLQALAIAGGVTERGARNRVTIRRVDSGRQIEVKVRDNDIVRPGDTIVVPKRRI
jgi:polysaccharide biosynthesis/export protein